MTLDEINELVSEIQLLLVSETKPIEEELMDLAGRHEDIVRETTKWLKSVDRLLQKGLRSEAIELAEREPNLNEVVIALDFPELDAWNELLARYEMQAIPDLPEGIAADLNDAYGVSAPVERLLQKHRTAALSRAPLSQRLQILRRLAVADKSSPAWPQDIREFEKHRLTELRNELDAAIREGSLDTLATLDNELKSGDWSSPVPVEMKKKAAEAHAKVRKSASAAEMEVLAYQLSDSFAAFDLESAKSQSNRFNALNQITGLLRTDPLMDIAGPALDWVREALLQESRESQFQATLVAIESGIDQGASATDLERLYYEATRHDHQLPERLQIRLNDRLETLRIMSLRRRRTMIGASVVVLLLVLAVTGFTIHQVRLGNDIHRHKTQLAVLLEEAERTGRTQPLDEYFALLSEESASISQAPEIVGLKQQFENLKLQEGGRTQKLGELLSRASADSQKAIAPGDFKAIFESLKSASDLAKNDDEQTSILRTESAIREKEIQLQKNTDQAFSAELAKITDRVAVLPKDDVAPYDTLLTELTGISATPDVSPGMLESVRLLQSRLQSERMEVSRGLEVARLLTGVTNAVGDANLFGMELRRYAEQYAGTSRAKDFERVVRTEQDVAAGVLRWNRIRDRLRTIDYRRLSPQDAKVLVDEFAQFQKTSGPYPGEMGLGDRILILQAISKRRPVSDGIRMLFEGKAVSSSYMIETADERERYYADAAPLFDKRLKFDYFTTPAGDQTLNKELGLFAFPDAEKKPRDEWLSPQTRLARSIIESAESSSLEDFENFIRLTADRILKDEPKIDPILRMLLVERALELGSQGSHFIEARTKKLAAAFADGGVPRLTNWVNYQETQNRKLRETAREFLEKHSGDISKALADAENDRDMARDQPIGPPVQWIGWIARNESTANHWEIRTKSSITTNSTGRLCVIARQSATAKPEIVNVGSLGDGQRITINDQIESTLPVEGRPVFLMAGPL